MGRSCFYRRTGFRNAQRVIFVALDCRRPEAVYFSALKPVDGSLLHIIPLDPSMSGSPKKQLLSKLKAWLRKTRTKPNDEIWLVVDREQRAVRDLDALCAVAKDLKINVAMSNPCFELWLWLHARDSREFPNADECRKAFETEFPQWQDPRSSAGKLVSNGITSAMARAAALDRNPTSAWPREQATRVHRLVMKLLTSKEGG